MDKLQGTPEQLLAPSVETIGAIDGITLGNRGNGDDRLRYSVLTAKPGETVTFDGPTVETIASIGEATLGARGWAKDGQRYMRGDGKATPVVF